MSTPKKIKKQAYRTERFNIEVLMEKDRNNMGSIGESICYYSIQLATLFHVIWMLSEVYIKGLKIKKKKKSL